MLLRVVFFSLLVFMPHCPLGQQLDDSYNPQVVDWYLDLCAPTISVGTAKEVTSIQRLSSAQYKAQLTTAACKYSSQKFRQEAQATLQKARSGVAPMPKKMDAGVTWANRNCPVPSPGSINITCPHPTTWFYTRNDGNIGMSCAAKAPTGVEAEVKQFMLDYAADNAGWLEDFSIAFTHMMAAGAKWATRSFFPTFAECPSGWVPTATCGCTAPNLHVGPNPCAACNTLPPPATDQSDAPIGPPAAWACPTQDCMCITGFKDDQQLKVDATM